MGCSRLAHLVSRIPALVVGGLVRARRGAPNTALLDEALELATATDKKPLPGAVYGSFGAACHYEDGNFIFGEVQADCSDTHPETGAAFTFWHPELVTLHLWAWYHNPAGIYNGTNRLIRPFNES